MRRNHRGGSCRPRLTLSQLFIFWIVLAVPSSGQPSPESRSLLANGSFEAGLSGWLTDHPWYEFRADGRGKGLSRWFVEEADSRSGARSLRVEGADNRGIAMQILRLPPAVYRASGWIRCENMGAAEASILLEFLDRNGKWMQGITIGSVTGTTGWTYFEKEVRFPPETVWLHFDLLTSGPNAGKAWFDDLRLVPADSGAPPTITPTIEPANAGQVRLAWNPPSREGIRRYEVFVEPEAFRSTTGRRPRVILDWTENRAVLSVDRGWKAAYVRVVAVGVNGRRGEESAAMRVALKDTLPPQAVELQVRSSAAQPGALMIAWEPAGLEEDIAAFRLYAAGKPTEDVSQTRALGKLLDASRRIVQLSRSGIPKMMRWIGVAAADSAGNVSPIAWKPIPEPTGVLKEGQCDLWVTSSLHNVFHDTPAPAGSPKQVEMLTFRNESECAQIVLVPQETLREVTLEAEPLVHQNGRARIAPEHIVWNFIGSLHVEKNSTETPPEELLRKAPDDFPDPLLEERVLDLPPKRNQPVMLRVFTPKGTPPGIYQGAVHILSAQGSLRVPLQVEVLGYTLPDQLPIYVTNWFNVGNIARYHSLTEWTEEFWMMLRAYAREMARGHQNVVLTPLDLVKIWREEDGRLTFDYTDFDRWVTLFDREGVAERIELSHLGGRTTGEWECPTFSLSARTATDRKTGTPMMVEIEQFLPDLQRHLEAKGWLKKTILHIGDEPIMVNVASWREQSARAHRAAPKLKRIDAIHVPYSEVKGHLEVLVPQLNYFAQWLEGYRQAQQQDGQELWFYIAWVPQGKYTNRLIDLACIKTRLIHWINFLYGATGYLHWGLNFWTDFKEMGFAPGDNWILYPGRRGPRSSLRWEAMRDGLEDFACFHLLAKRQPEEARRLAQRVMRSVTDYDQDPARLESVRREAMRLLGAAARTTRRQP
jgi:hypothetical protein